MVCVGEESTLCRCGIGQPQLIGVYRSRKLTQLVLTELRYQARRHRSYRQLTYSLRELTHRAYGIPGQHPSKPARSRRTQCNDEHHDLEQVVLERLDLANVHHDHKAGARLTEDNKVNPLSAWDVWLVDARLVALEFNRGIRLAESRIARRCRKERRRIFHDAVQIVIGLPLEQGFNEDVFVVLGDECGRDGKAQAQREADEAVSQRYPPAQRQPGNHVISPRR